MFNKFLAVIAFALLSFFACKKDGDATIKIRLTDGPADYEAVNIEILSAKVHTSNDTADQSGWQNLPINAGVYDLLQLSNGLDTLLGSMSLPSGHVSQIRLTLGDNNTLKNGGVIYPLEIKGGDKDQLKIQVHQEIEPGNTYSFLLDFDAGKSIKESGNDKYKLKPVVRLVDATTSGVIKGYISPSDCKSVVYAISATDTLTTRTNKSSGYFMLQGLNPGTYKVLIAPKSPCAEKTIDNVIVEVGKSKDLGKIEL
jgi:Domain of unknown function (DUF4382)